MSNYIPYPEIDNKNFQKKIFYKKEFYDTKPEKLPNPDNQSDETMSKLFPQGKDFRLQSGQQFLRNFLSEATPYNGILVYHGTGTGKTCAAISIAERFHSRVDKTGKKILLVVNKSIQNEFYKTIFNLEKEETKKHRQVVQCTGRTYKLGKDSKYLSQIQKEKHIKNMINDVYEIIGRGKLRNKVIKETGWDGNEETLNEIFINKLKELYSNRVIIIDEAHNRAQTADKDDKFPSTLKAIISSTENTKLILMSATPMVNRPSDILILLNLLRLNDNKPFIKNSSIFKGDGTLVKGGKELLKEISKGYVSYIRGGETPRFPYKVIPAEAVVPTPKYLFNGDKIPENEKITHTKVIKCYMDIYQFNTYYQVLQSDLKSKIGGILPGTTQASIIVFPTKDKFGTYGSSGFGSIKNDEHSLLITKDSFGNNIYQYSDFSSGFLLRKNIGKYSTKFASIFDNIINSVGISFVSSHYVQAGIVPLSLILEENGFEPAIIIGKEKPLLKSKTKKPLICYLCGKPKHSTTDHKWSSAKYVVLTGEENLSVDEMAKISGYINRKENMDGKLVKVLLGSSVAGEGIDFKRIRQVHIVESWYNQAKIDQITGRAIRNGSHRDLPPEKRNVEIFKYCAVPPQKLKAKERDIESIDEHNYRMSEDKDKKIKDIDMIMKEVAVDCMFQRDNNIRNINRTIKLENSRGKIINYVTGDKAYSRECNYLKSCTYKCDWEPNNIKDININKSTYSVEFVEIDIENVINVLYDIYKKDTIVDIDIIFEIVRSEYPHIDDVYVYLALEKLMDKNNIYSLQDKYKRNGYLVERGNLYIYQPMDLDNKEAPVIYKETPIQTKPTDIAFSETDFKDHLNIEKEVQKSGDKVFDNIFNYYTILHNNIDKLIENKPLYVLDIILDMALYKLSDIDSISLLKYIVSPLYKKNENKEKEVFKIMIEKYYIDNKNIYKKGINLAIMIGPYSYQWDRSKHGSKKKKTNDWGMCDIEIESNMNTQIKNMMNSLMWDKISSEEIIENEITQSNYLSIITKENLRPSYIATLDTKNPTLNKQLKIFDFITYTKSNKDISKRKELRGRVCTTIMVPDLKKMKINLLKEVEKISNIKIINENGKKIRRPNICIQIEFLLRLLNEKTKLKWFFKGNFKNDDM
jgi:hypothetical protein